MKKRILCLFSILGLLACGQDSRFAANNPSKDLAHKIDALIRPLAESNNFSGTVLVKKNGDIILSQSYGYADRENQIKNTKASQFFIGSVSAMFTATAILQLVESGKVSLEDTLTKFMPGFPNGDRITIHHLLTERSGLPRFVSQADGTYDQLIESPHTLDVLVEYIKELKPIAEPGEKYRHSGSSFILLAKVIEMVSGESFGTYLNDHVFKPLGMSHTGHYAYAMSYTDVPDLTLGYKQQGVTELERARVIHWSTKIGHASIYSNAEDLEKFARAMMHNRVLSADSWKKMTSSYYGTSLGYGLSNAPQGDHVRYSRSGGSPGFSSYFAVYPEEGLTVIMLSNIHIHVPYFNVPKIASIVFGEPYEPLNLVSPTYVKHDLAQKLLGTFQFDENFYNPNGTVTISFEDGMLLSDGAPMIPVLGEDGKIVKFINRQFWSRLEFVPDSTGQFSNLKFDDFMGTKKITLNNN
ncbi:serine hydrolase [Ulvibacterium sp.]|uniref:serine hydrolase domain-containing protein n=1 Tax=Ulvibacterium sp. TaxID=2665914 RepID=UPI002625A411|nr:serine hydrolase domain-containing protein [Ulvibacterium sp.]